MPASDAGVRDDRAPIDRELVREMVGAAAAIDTSPLIAELIELCFPYDAFDLMVNFFYANVPLNPNTYRESTHQGLSAISEFMVILLLSRTSRHGSGSRDSPIPANVYERGDEIVRQLLSVLYARLTADNFTGDVDALRFSIRGREVVLRYPSFAHIERLYLDGLFTDDLVRDGLVAQLGFDHSDARAVLDALEKLPESRLRARADEVRGAQGYFKRRGGSRKSRRERKALKNAFTVWFWIAIGDAHQFTVEQLAEASGVAPLRVRAFLDRFSSQFGAGDPAAFLQGKNPIRDRPIVQDGNDYLCTNWGNLFYALRPAFEESLKSNKRLLDRFSKVRAEFVEKSATDGLARALNAQTKYTNIEYRDNGAAAELDGLVGVDTCLVLVEAKSGSMTPPARRGAPLRLRDDLEKLIGDAVSQARRARTAIERDGGLQLVHQIDGKNRLDFADVTTVTGLAVSLEDLSWIAPAVKHLIEAGIIDSSTELPLIMSLHDLLIMCDIVELPCLLLHYFARRERINRTMRVFAGDELDLFMFYLNKGLYLDDVFAGPEAPDAVFVTSLTDPLDAYYLHGEGVRTKPAPRPRQKMPPILKEILTALESARPPGYMSSSLLLLEMAGDERDRLAKGLGLLRRRSGRDRRYHDFTMTFGVGEGSFGLTIMSAHPEDAEALSRRLAIYCMAKKYQVRADGWVGFGVYAGAQGPFQYYVANHSPWDEKDEVAREAMETLGLKDKPDGSGVEEEDGA